MFILQRYSIVLRTPFYQNCYRWFFIQGFPPAIPPSPERGRFFTHIIQRTFFVVSPLIVAMVVVHHLCGIRDPQTFGPFFPHFKSIGFLYLLKKRREGMGMLNWGKIIKNPVVILIRLVIGYVVYGSFKWFNHLWSLWSLWCLVFSLVEMFDLHCIQ